MNQTQAMPELPAGFTGISIVTKGPSTNLGIVVSLDTFAQLQEGFVNGTLPEFLTDQNVHVAPGTARFAVKTSEIVMLFEFGKPQSAARPIGPAPATVPPFTRPSPIFPGLGKQLLGGK